jgi:hypothetical protein
MTHISQEDTLSDGSLSCWLELQRWPTLSPWPARHLDTPMTRPHDLRNHNSPWIPRLEVDLRGPRRRQPPQYRRRFGQQCRDLGLPQRDASVPGRHNHSRFALPSRPVGGKQQIFGREQSFVAGRPRTFSLWSRIQQSTPRRAVGGSVTSTQTASLAPRP